MTVEVKENGRKSPTWSLQGDLYGNLTLHDLLTMTKKALIAISSDALREEQSQGFDREPLRLVDGSPSKQVQDVNPLGKIQYIARQNIRDVIVYAYEAVMERSPFLSGEYLESNVVTYNGRQVANTLAGVKQWLETQTFNNKDKIRILNTAPYARKLELRGIRKGVTHPKWGAPSRHSKGERNSQGQVRKPNGAYTLAEKAIKAKYGRNAFIKYELMLGSTIGLTGEGRVRKTGADKGRPYVYPSILIYAFDTSATPEGTYQ